MNVPLITKIMWDLSSFSAPKVMITTPKKGRGFAKPVFLSRKKNTGDETWKPHVVEISTVNAWDYKLLFLDLPLKTKCKVYH